MGAAKRKGERTLRGKKKERSIREKGVQGMLSSLFLVGLQMEMENYRVSWYNGFELEICLLNMP